VWDGLSVSVSLIHPRGLNPALQARVSQLPADDATTMKQDIFLSLPFWALDIGGRTILSKGLLSLVPSMCEPKESSQLKSWLFTPEVLDMCRARANRVARKSLAEKSDGTNSPAPSTGSNDDSPGVECFARDFKEKKGEYINEEEGPWENMKGHAFLNPSEEALLVSFYGSKLPSLIGPMAQIPPLRRESKVPATAGMLLRRFYLSNSVMVHDPKTIMVAAAFLASKVEDAMTSVKYLEEGTNSMNAPVSQADILPAEINVLSGIHFDLLCFHPYKAVLAMTEDLRTYLKSEKGRSLVRFQNGNHRPIVGQDLKPMHDAAQLIVNDVVVSDIPLLYTPGQVGLAALMVANEQQIGNVDIPQIDILGYLSQRFEYADLEGMKTLLRNLSAMLRDLKEGKYGCANHNVDLQTLKGIHKKLKKCRVWGVKEKKKKRKNAGEDGPDSKRTKTS
jgi:cyclin H